MTPTDAERYRKLPGHRRGLVHGASLWLGSDHLLAVTSSRFREDYKRFHLRDIQAIVVAESQRFHISSRAIAIGAILLVTWLFARLRFDWATYAFAGAALTLMVAWLYISMACSCRCRIFTAVSKDELPSIYRTWTARKFIDALQPKISEVQGVIEGPWAEAIENRHIGPPEFVPSRPGAAPHAISGTPAPKAPARGRTTASDLLVTSLWIGSVLTAISLYSNPKMLQWLLLGVVVVQFIGGIWVLVDYSKGLVTAGMQRLAIASLLVTGVLYYGRTIGYSMGAAEGPFRGFASTGADLLFRKMHLVSRIVLALIGATLSFFARDEGLA
jgi:hypothetical protein